MFCLSLSQPVQEGLQARLCKYTKTEQKQTTFFIIFSSYRKKNDKASCVLPGKRQAMSSPVLTTSTLTVLWKGMKADTTASTMAASRRAPKRCFRAQSVPCI